MPYGEHTRTYGLGINLQFGGLFRLNPIFQVMFDCNNGIDPKYGLGDADYTCATSAQYISLCADDRLVNATYFDGNTYGEIPEISGVGKVVSIKFVWDGTVDSYMFDGRIAGNTDINQGALLINSSAHIQYWGFTDVRVDGNPIATDTFKVTPNNTYTLTFTLSPVCVLINLFGRYTDTLGFTGFAKDLIIYDTDGKTQLHNYPLSSIGTGNTFEDIINPDSKQPELVVNGDFSDGNIGWSRQDNWDATSGQAVYSNGTGRDMFQFVGTIVGGKYIARMDITSVGSGGVGIYSPESSDASTIDTYHTAVGSYSRDITCDDLSTSFRFRVSGTTAIATIDNISVKQTFSGQYTGTPSISSQPAGTIMTADIDEPRIEAEGILLEGGATNLLTYSRDFNQWAKYNGAIVDSNYSLAPNGSFDADRVHSYATNLNNLLTRNYSVDAANRTYTYTVYLRGSGTISLQLSNNIDESQDLQVQLTGDFARHTLTHTFNATSTTAITVKLQSRAGDTATEFEIWQADLVELPFPTSPIYTEGAAVQRAPTNLTYPALGNFTPEQFSIEVEFDLSGLTGGIQNIIRIFSGNQEATVRVLSNSQIQGRLVDGVNTDSIATGVYDSSSGVKVVFINDGTNLTLMVDGVVIGVIPRTAAMTIASSIAVGWNGANSNVHMYGHIKTLKINDYDVLNPPKNSDLTEWTPNFNGTSVYAQLFSAWQPSGSNWSVRLKGYNSGQSTNAYALSFGTTNKLDVAGIFTSNVSNASNLYQTGIGGGLAPIDGFDESDILDLEFNSDKEIVQNGVVIGGYSGSVLFQDKTSIGALVRSYVSNFFNGQVQLVEYNDLDDPTNSLVLELTKKQVSMPTNWELVNKTTKEVVGSFPVLDASQQSVPVLKGGEIDGSNSPDKFEAYNSNFNLGAFIGGVSISASNMTSSGDEGFIGSYFGGVGSSIILGSILVAKNGAVVKVSVENNANTLTYTTLQGTDEEIQKGFEHPRVFRVLKPDADPASEYYYYENGGTYPFTGA